MKIEEQINALKGIHPGIFLARELKKRQLSGNDIALTIGSDPQIINDFISGKCSLSKLLATKIEHELQLNDGLLSALQYHYNLKKSRDINGHRDPIARPDVKKFRRALFWDTRIENIRWDEQKPAIIKRIFERGNEQEKQEITRFYGKSTIERILPHALTRS
ncbi:helix-turn-helix transcriptional regulator [Chitinophaga cymbidii]|uniref:DUF6922 domain-containing protein n=1 Tax=Chitinophaga cymbidii TaxID=1096750 RepID=A0A512RNS7_9BACT|nr:plasmid maintenance system antidote protein [Chitinophaga cymbidii]GEP97360.1 hypothetical protein CCY01nite_36200 [Chitinophaga cymbidii]